MPARRSSRDDGSAGVTRWLLLAGIVGPVIFVLVFLVDGATRPGYDPVRNLVSVLSLGDGGWVQAANFVASGLLLAAFGVGLQRDPRGQRSRWLPPLMVLTGMALAWTGLFPPDPQLGYPQWISMADAANPTWHDRLHLAGGFVAASAFSVAIMLEAVSAARAGAPARAAYPVVSAAIMLGCFLASLAVEAPTSGLPLAGLLQRVGIVAGLQWLVTFAATQLREPNWGRDIRPEAASPLARHRDPQGRQPASQATWGM